MLGKRRKKTDLPAVCAVIVAAGSSRRMGGENKLLLEIDGVPVLARTLSAFLHSFPTRRSSDLRKSVV